MIFFNTAAKMIFFNTAAKIISRSVVYEAVVKLINTTPTMSIEELKEVLNLRIAELKKSYQEELEKEKCK